VHDDATIAHAVFAAGADGVVLKRAIATDLLAAVDAVEQGRKYVSADVRSSTGSHEALQAGLRA